MSTPGGLIYCVQDWTDTFCITYLFYIKRKKNSLVFSLVSYSSMDDI